MKNNPNKHHNALKIYGRKIFLVMKMLIVLICCFTLSLSAAVKAQDQQVTLKVSDKSLTEVIDLLKQQTNLEFFYSHNEVDVNKRISLDVKNKRLSDVMKRILGNGYACEFTDNVVLIRPQAQAQVPQKNLIIKGKIIDNEKKPMPGAVVMIVGTAIGVTSDPDGSFTIKAAAGDVLEFSFLGYTNSQYRVTKAISDLVIMLKYQPKELEDAVVVAYGTQRRESLVGSVSQVTARQLKSSSSDLTTNLAGNIAGIIGWQTGGIPGALTEEGMNTKFYIRGLTSFKGNSEPLILLDGVESSKLDLARINPEDIESFNVMKDASATAMYGARGANGVIYVTTKKGQAGDVYTTLSYEAVASEATKEIEVVSPTEYMELYNEALTGRNSLQTPRYTRQDIENRKNKDLPFFLYPANDWYDILFKKMVVNHRVGATIRGGSNKVQYYASLNYNQDNGMLKTDRLNQFDVNIKNQGTSLRINLNIDLTKDIKLVVNSFSTYDKQHGPAANVYQAYYLAFSANPVNFAVTYPADDYYKWNHIRFGGSDSSENPYALIHEGYNDQMRYSTINRAEYIHKLDFITFGLEARANASLSQEGYFYSVYKTKPYYYFLDPNVDYDFATGKHTLHPIQPESSDSKLSSYPDKEYSTATTRISFDARLMYSRAWNQHQLSSTLVYNVQEMRIANSGTLFNSYPHRNLSFSGRISYGFMDKYFLEGSFGYNGSERFTKEHRFGFFPSLGGSWILSKERFMNSLKTILPFMKVRLSWGKVGNDGIGNTKSGHRFIHISQITNNRIESMRPGKPIENGYIIENYANPYVTWEVSEQQNLGLDLKLLKVIEINSDFYKEIRRNLIADRTTIPASLGLFQAPIDNVGTVVSRGIDLSFKYQQTFRNDLWIIFNGTFTYNKAKFRSIQEATNKPEYQKKTNREISQQYGFIADGLFYDQEEIDSSPFQGGNVMPGDIRYKDVNKDGKIDDFDVMAIGYPETPRIIYGFNAFVNYKHLEFSFAFQGLGERSFFIDAESISPFDGNKAVLKAIAKDHWSPINMTDKPFWPRLSVTNIISYNPQEQQNQSGEAEQKKSTYFMNSGKFLRCKSIELGYNFSNNIAKKVYMKNIKIFLRTNNPFILSGFKIWDIELGANGFNYPIQRTFSCGINASF